MIKLKKAKVTEIYENFMEMGFNDFQLGEMVYIVRSYSFTGMNDDTFVPGLFLCISAERGQIGEIPEVALEIIDYEERKEFEPAFINGDWFKGNGERIECVVLSNQKDFSYLTEHKEQIELEKINRRLAAAGAERIDSLADVLLVSYDSEVQAKGKIIKIKQFLVLPKRSVTYWSELDSMEAEHEKDMRDFNNYKKGV